MRRSVPPALVSLISDVVDASRPMWPGTGHGSTRIQRAAEVLEERRGASRFARLRQLFGGTDRRRLITGDLAATATARVEDASGQLRALYDACDGTDLRRMRYVDIRTYLADCLMPKADVSSMAHALELRAPLLDHDIVRFAMSLSDELLCDGTRGKTVLRSLISRYLPAPLFKRPKQGFTPPVSEWLRTSHAASARGLARSERFATLGWFNLDSLASLADEHINGRRDHGDRLFALLVLDEWLRQQD
jgi:asparagine synthase (glutamine-hydrolysing)